MQFFKANEVAHAAVEIERKGQAFYQRVAAAAQTPEAQKLFQYMVGEEAKHEAIFQALANRLEKIEIPAYSNPEEYEMYLEALINSHALFTGGLAEKLMGDAEDLETAVRMAMAFEKDTLLFFMEMRELVPDSEKEFVTQCIEEERSHLRMLRGLLSAHTQ